MKNLQHERRTVERALVSTEKRCNYYQGRLTNMETDNRNLRYFHKLGKRTLDYKSSLSHTHHTTSNYDKERIDDSSNKRRSLIQGDNQKKLKNGRFDVSDQMPIETDDKTGNSEESLTEIESFFGKNEEKFKKKNHLPNVL